jgi:hypothetical protein
MKQTKKAPHASNVIDPSHQSREDLLAAAAALRRFQQDILLRDYEIGSGGRVKVASQELSRHIECLLKAAMTTV